MDASLEAPRRRMPAWAPQVLGYCLSAACLLWVLHGYPIGELIPTIRGLDWRWVSLAVISDLSVYVVHGWRWNTLLRPVIRLRLWGTVQAIYIGLFANEVLPLRVGEVIRCYLLAHWNDLRLSVGFASIALERLIDGFWMITAFLITASFVDGIPEKLKILVLIIGALILAGAVVLLWILLLKKESHAAIAESRWSAILRHAIEGLHLMGNARTLAYTALISLLYLVLQFLSAYCLMKAYGLDLSFWVAAGVLTIIRFATVVPNAPGNLGLFQVACVLAMRLFDVEPNDAKTFSFIMFFALTLPLLIGGAVATALTGLNLGELHDRAKRSVRAAHNPR
ncbi:MAG TPA: lysylphosphatidylglycerol synthase transmembrane domain-containing protein [Bryobacteraceae bacterium]|nr:lysylphosphatidylglycerol synthase transmembrane domain-containing protein [Bryobacteraceae bacterium]